MINIYIYYIYIYYITLYICAFNITCIVDLFDGYQLVDAESMHPKHIEYDPCMWHVCECTLPPMSDSPFPSQMCGSKHQTSQGLGCHWRLRRGTGDFGSIWSGSPVCLWMFCGSAHTGERPGWSKRFKIWYWHWTNDLTQWLLIITRHHDLIVHLLIAVNSGSSVKPSTLLNTHEQDQLYRNHSLLGFSHPSACDLRQSWNEDVRGPRSRAVKSCISNII